MRLTFTVVAAILLTVTGLCGCTAARAASIPLNIPPEYYNCTEVTPQVICDAYFSRYGNIAEAQYRFDGLLFVFKNVEVTDSMFKHIDEGYTWVDNLVRCFCVNIDDLKRYKIGDKIDVVGKNEGVVLNFTGLKFGDCIIMPAGSVQLPAPGGTGVAVPVY